MEKVYAAVYSTFLILLLIYAIFRNLWFLSSFSPDHYDLILAKEAETDRTGKRRAYVFSMEREQSHEQNRLNRFKKAWSSAYSDLGITKITTYNSMRGVSLAGFSFEAVGQAIVDDVDIALFLEDDGLPFISNLTWKEDFDAKVKAWPRESPVLFLGGHHIEALHGEKEKKLGIGRAARLLGTYAYAVRRSHLKGLYSYLGNQLNKLDNRLSSLSQDVDWWTEYFTDSSPAYITLPLLVDHSPGYSSTWGKFRKDSWSGRPEWWKIKNVHSKHP